jgi:hypothetical protein
MSFILKFPDNVLSYSLLPFMDDKSALVFLLTNKYIYYKIGPSHCWIGRFIIGSPYPLPTCGKVINVEFRFQAIKYKQNENLSILLSLNYIKNIKINIAGYLLGHVLVLPSIFKYIYDNKNITSLDLESSDINPDTNDEPVILSYLVKSTHLKYVKLGSYNKEHFDTVIKVLNTLNLTGLHIETSLIYDNDYSGINAQNLTISCGLGEIPDIKRDYTLQRFNNIETYSNGLLHSINDKPSRITRKTKRIEYHKHGKLHRDIKMGPALIRESESKFYIDGIHVQDPNQDNESLCLDFLFNT